MELCWCVQLAALSPMVVVYRVYVGHMDPTWMEGGAWGAVGPYAHTFCAFASSSACRQHRNSCWNSAELDSAIQAAPNTDRAWIPWASGQTLIHYSSLAVRPIRTRRTSCCSAALTCNLKVEELAIESRRQQPLESVVCKSR